MVVDPLVLVAAGDPQVARLLPWCDDAWQQSCLRPRHGIPIERCWGILELHWNSATLLDTQTMLAWARSMTWMGLHPIVQFSDAIYEKGISIGRDAMKDIESRLHRNPTLPKWDIVVRLL